MRPISAFGGHGVFDRAFRRFDTAEGYAAGNSELEMCVSNPRDAVRVKTDNRLHRGRVIRELNLRRTDLVITTKLFFGTRRGPNDMGLSRKQYVTPSIDRAHDMTECNLRVRVQHHRGCKGFSGASRT